MVHVGVGDFLPFFVPFLLLGDWFADSSPAIRRGYHVLLGVALVAAGVLLLYLSVTRHDTTSG